MQCILSSATVEILSYVAHEKRLPAQISDPKCRPQKRADSEYCSHVDAYLSQIYKENRAGLRKPDGETLLEVGRMKKMMCKTGIDRAAKYRFANHRQGIAFACPDDDSPHLHLSSGYFKRMTEEVSLRDKLNSIGRDYPSQIDNTGAYTILKHLNDLEMAALSNIVERDAPECMAQLERFKYQTHFTYRTMGVVDGVGPRYEETATPPISVRFERLPILETGL
jgi:hypothetical protein